MIISALDSISMKIHITGNAGAGKTSFARQLGQDLGIPVFGLDIVVWQAGWIKTPAEIKTIKIQSLISQDEWVIEGVSDTVRNAADIVIFLDVNRATSYWRCAKRNWRYLFKSRDELPDNCPEILILPRLLKIIWRFKHHVRPKILADMARRPNVYFRVNQPQDLLALQQHLGIKAGGHSFL